MEKKYKMLALASIFVFIFLLLPVFYLSFVNRATGDDYNYGIYTRAAWMGSHSLIAVFGEACRTVKQFYYSWQGTWFSIFMFSLHPEVFHDGAYFIVTFLMLFLWIGSTFYLFGHILYKYMKINKWVYILATVVFLIISIEFISSTASSMFFFNGCAHYMLPFVMCQTVTVWLLQYSQTYHKRTFTGIVIFMTLLGGSNYLAALFALIVACYTGISTWFLKKDKRVLALFIPVFLELIGLIISMMAPGNNVRVERDKYEIEEMENIVLPYGEEGDFGFSALRGVKTVVYSFANGITDIGKHIKERPLVFAGLLFLFLIFLVFFYMEKEAFYFKHPIWLSLMLFCLYCAMYAPSIYAGVPVSGGVPNTEYQVFLLAASGILLIAAQGLAYKMKRMQKEAMGRQIFRGILIFGSLFCLIMVFSCRRNIKTSTSYKSLIYITSGEASDFKEQMDLQTRLMEDPQTEDVVVPFINNVQGPLMHMPVTDDTTKFTNWATAQFYGKNSVVAMERPAWMEMYSDLVD